MVKPVLILVLLVALVSCQTQSILYAFTSSASATSTQVTIPGLSITLPAASSAYTYALLTFTAGAPYATGNNFPGCNFYLSGPSFTPQYGFTSLTYNDATPVSSGRIPASIVARIPLSTSTTTVIASMVGVRGATCNIDSLTTLSAVLGTDINILAASTTGSASTVATASIPSLAVDLPASSSAATLALLTLEFGAPYASGTNVPGCNFYLTGPSLTPTYASGGFTYSEIIPTSSGRVPFSLQVVVPLSSTITPINSAFSGVRSGTCLFDSYSSLTAYLGTSANIISASTSSGSTTAIANIPGLNITLPAASAQYNTALVTLTVSTPYGPGTNFPGCDFYITGASLTPTFAHGSFSYSKQAPVSYGRRPFVLEVPIALFATTSNTVFGAFAGVRGGSCVVDSLATITAVLGWH